MGRMILAGDIGGTKTVLARAARTAQGVAIEREEVYSSAAHTSLEAIVAKFLATEREPIEVACFGVAGPVLDGECRTTNLPWLLREEDLARELGARRVKLLNDLEAAALGMLLLPSDEVFTLQAGTRDAPGTIAVLAAGTGLGEAILRWDGERHVAQATEGGHATFAPQTAEDWALVEFLQARHGEHVSWERVVSGPAFVSIYEFFRDRRLAPEPAWLQERLVAENPSAVITEVGLRGDEPLCRATVETFARLYGAEAGNLVLKSLAVGGVFLGGNIANVIFPAMREHFLRGFTRKGRFSPLLASLRVRVAQDARAPLLGAAHYAATL